MLIACKFFILFYLYGGLNTGTVQKQPVRVQIILVHKSYQCERVLWVTPTQAAGLVLVSMWMQPYCGKIVRLCIEIECVVGCWWYWCMSICRKLPRRPRRLFKGRKLRRHRRLKRLKQLLTTPRET